MEVGFYIILIFMDIQQKQISFVTAQIIIKQVTTL